VPSIIKKKKKKKGDSDIHLLLFENHQSHLLSYQFVMLCLEVWREMRVKGKGEGEEMRGEWLPLSLVWIGKREGE
jgi:hypothetical protein